MNNSEQRIKQLETKVKFLEQLLAHFKSESDVEFYTHAGDWEIISPIRGSYLVKQTKDKEYISLGTMQEVLTFIEGVDSTKRTY